MAKIVTPSPDFFTQSVLNETQPSNAALATRKFNRPWMLFRLSEDTSIIIPNRSNASIEGYEEDYVTDTPGKPMHLRNAGFDIPNALIVRGREHELLLDWGKINPDQQERLTQLKSVSEDVANKTKRYLREFGDFAKQTQRAKYPDELPSPNTEKKKFLLLSRSGLQYQQEYIPAQFLNAKEPLKPVITFDEYPQSLKSQLSRDNVSFVEPETQDVYETPFTYVTPLQAQTQNVLEHCNSSEQFILLTVLQNRYPGREANNAQDYLNRTPHQIQTQLETDTLKHQQVPADVVSQATVVEAKRQAKYPQKSAVSPADDLVL